MSVNGGKISRTPISVDYFQRQHLPSRTLYFLTHLHTDHTYGLDSSFDQKIYCTSITKKLLLLELSLDPDLLVELEYDNPIQVHVDCPCDVVTIAVTAIDSFHCPGSAMYLFQGYFGTILHTGDFRFTPELSTHPLLQSLEPDILYLDNTYNNPIYDFPSRTEARDKITQLVCENSHLRTFLAFNKLGKEDILKHLVIQTGYTIGVSEKQFNKMEVLQLNEICSLDIDKCQIVTVPFSSVTLTNVKRWTEDCPTQIIIPTCRYLGRECRVASHPSVTIVHHSDHSSYNELCQFVELVRPVSIKPIVHREDVCNLSHFDSLLSSKQPIDYDIPLGVQMLHEGVNSAKSSAVKRPLNRSLSVNKRSLVPPKGVQFVSPKKAKLDDSDESDESDESIQAQFVIIENYSQLDEHSLVTNRAENGNTAMSNEAFEQWFYNVSHQLAKDILLYKQRN